MLFHLDITNFQVIYANTIIYLNLILYSALIDDHIPTLDDPMYNEIYLVAIMLNRNEHAPLYWSFMRCPCSLNLWYILYSFSGHSISNNIYSREIIIKFRLTSVLLRTYMVNCLQIFFKFMLCISPSVSWYPIKIFK